MSSRFVFLVSMDILETIPQYHTFFLTILFLSTAWWLSKRRGWYSSGVDLKTRKQQLEDSIDLQIEKKLERWEPEPLVPQLPEDLPSLNPKTVSSRLGKYVVVDDRKCLNLATHNYLGLVDNPEVEAKATSAVQKYGVGSCGPRGFYGTVDVHLELEERIAKFMDMEEAVVYSYGFSTIASAIPAFCKRKDIVIADEKVNFSVQKGLDATRASIRYFKHNDPRDLEKLLMLQDVEDKKNPRKAGKIRRFLIVEGIYMNTGEICPLPEMVRLCRKYKLRIFVDESVSFGTLGKTGRGLTEYYGIPKSEIDMIMGSLENSIASIGGFCVGTSFVIEHHRLSGLGYCFSASLPPLLTVAATTAIDLLDNDSNLIERLKNNCKTFHDRLISIPELECFSFVESPVKHLHLKKMAGQLENYDEEERLLGLISEECFKNNLAIIRPSYLKNERIRPRPSLRICISTNLTEGDIHFATDTLKCCVTAVF